MKHTPTAYHQVPFLPPKAGIHLKKPKKSVQGESLCSLEMSIEEEGGRLKVESTNTPALCLLSFGVKGKSPSALQWIYKPFWINSKSVTGSHPRYRLSKLPSLINGYFSRHKCEGFAKLQVLQPDYHWRPQAPTFTEMLTASRTILRLSASIILKLRVKR
ncbi:MAG: hypothetical protein N3E45_13955 [Oscillatoriaceae bacterium SKW80]|nr:hypothetical protein [Oscillatoriaceae bacterium SKYG93]MCX8121904.1 hypothetical protein [Oscillatoriaceae bacterium SKW80]MDW8454665.1 hypothetical protein [Oscillatoriaceae cyanobacterium SKYGB_i_bin93]HIK28630.1 hypothetical protein [Oscillatoriaceae cyanobacterium M7585_C2015_266]